MVRSVSNPLRPLRHIVFAALAVFVVSVGTAANLGVTDSILSKVETRFGSEARERLKSWERLVDTYAASPEREKLESVNAFFNDNIWFVNDIEHWGLEDYWATPIESLATGAGDCEDYSIAKFFTLRAMGVAESKLRITYVKVWYQGRNQAHMVLTYFEQPRRAPLVLDNINPTIVSALQRKDLKPVYNFNGEGLWLAQSSGSGKKVGGASRLSHWNDLQQRLRSGAWGG